MHLNQVKAPKKKPFRCLLWTTLRGECPGLFSYQVLLQSRWCGSRATICMGKGWKREQGRPNRDTHHPLTQVEERYGAATQATQPYCIDLSKAPRGKTNQSISFKCLNVIFRFADFCGTWRKTSTASCKRALSLCRHRLNHPRKRVRALRWQD